MGSNAEAKPGIRASFVRHMVRDSLSNLLNRLAAGGNVNHLPGVGDVGSIDPDHLPPRPEETSQTLPSDTKICIVGAGMSGLYAALILDHLGIPYDILEAAPRPGGRILTHYFSTRKHDYYDIGAMRFPNIPPMERYTTPSYHPDWPLTSVGHSICSKGQVYR